MRWLLSTEPSLIQLLLVDFPRISGNVCEHSALRIKPPLRLDQNQLRKEIVVRLDESHITGSEFVLDDDRQVFWLPAHAVHAGDQIGVVEIQPLRDRAQVLFSELFARQDQAEG